MEAAGVDLFGVLTARKLLILGSATTAKKAPLPDPLYVYCTIFSPPPRGESGTVNEPSIPQIRPDLIGEKFDLLFGKWAHFNSCEC